MKIDSTIAKAAKAYVKNYLAEKLDPKFEFHNLDHTAGVVKAVNTICFELGVDEHDKRIIQVAAWFHDTGYTERMEEHEHDGAMLAENFLAEHDVDRADIDMVKNCILATHYPQHPITLQEKILCDADMAHLAEKNYVEGAALLRKEWAVTRNKNFTEQEWLTINLEFLTGHSYHTGYCRETLEKGKQKNIRRLMELHTDPRLSLPLYRETEVISMSKKGKRDRSNEYGRGVETFFRIVSTNQMRLSGMADNKAHILLSVNSIIISVVLSVLAKKITEVHYLVIPTAFLLCVCLTAIVFAVLTTRPKISKAKLSDEQVNTREMNLLFFGHFHQITPEIYEGGIDEILKDRDYLYRTITKDVYFLGKVLAVKYRYLSIGYMVFMLGLIASVILYGISFFFS
jgi:predicted metal-dependent HD superfamily phosphohydrolase